MKQSSRLTRTILIVLGLAAGHIATSIYFSGVKDGNATAHATIQKHK
jgi:uncharacterized membrane protein